MTYLHNLNDNEFIDYLSAKLPGSKLRVGELDRLKKMIPFLTPLEADGINAKLAHLDPVVVQKGSTLHVGSRQAGKSNLLVNPNSTMTHQSGLHQPRAGMQGMQATGPLPQDFSPVNIGTGDVIRWVTRGRGATNRHVEYTYAAVSTWIKGELFWFITGAGKWYDTNQLTMQQMNEVLQRDEVITVEFCHQFMPAADALTRA